MQKILMILTKDRRDCVDMNLHLHERGGSFDVFDKVVFLLNDVTRSHMRFIDDWIARHPSVSCDKIIGDGTRPKGISDMQNRCIQKYPEGFYAKTDEDVFVPPDWARMTWEAYQTFKDNDDLALITPLLPNNSYGLYVLLNAFYPEYLPEHTTFNLALTPDRASPTWHSPQIAAWSTRKFINLAEANKQQRRRLYQLSTSNFSAEGGSASGGQNPASNQEPRTNNHEPSSPSTFPPKADPPLADNLQPLNLILPYSSFTLEHGAFHPFSIPFSIGCIAYDYRHWQQMKGIHETDEPGWCKWIEDNRKMNILDCRQIALHYTFFVQQRYLDRSTLLEEIRRVNIPETVSLAEKMGVNRLKRIASEMISTAQAKAGLKK